jgi:hypothetical protein
MATSGDMAAACGDRPGAGLPVPGSRTRGETVALRVSRTPSMLDWAAVGNGGRSGGGDGAAAGTIRSKLTGVPRRFGSA